MFYKPLTRENITHIIDLMVTDLNRRLEDKQLTVELTPAAKDHHRGGLRPHLRGRGPCAGISSTRWRR